MSLTSKIIVRPHAPISGLRKFSQFKVLILSTNSVIQCFISGLVAVNNGGFVYLMILKSSFTAPRHFGLLMASPFFWSNLFRLFGHLPFSRRFRDVVLLLRASEQKVLSSQFYKTTIGIPQKGHPEFKVLRCSNKSLDSKASV